MEITDTNFNSEVVGFAGVTVLDFWAEWCGPCRILTPILDEIATEYQSDSRLKIAKLNVDENPITAQNFSVMSIPTLIIFQNGQPVKTIIGVRPKQTIKAEIEQLLG